MKKIIIFIFLLLCFFSGKAQIRLNDTIRIFFDLNVRNILLQNKNILDSLIKNLFSKSNTNISIIGYADYLGSDVYNQIISKQRAVHVKELLINGGIPDKRIISVNGKGGQKKVNEDTDQKGNYLHRRVDIIVPKIKSDDKQNTQKNNITDLKQSIADLKVGETLIAKNLNFEGGRHFLLQESFPELKKLWDILLENPNLKIEIQGHICCDDGKTDGLDFDTNEYKLSENRAKYIYDYLIQKGIQANRLKYKGFGRSKPIIEHEITDEERRTNRRVEIMILEK